MKLAERNSGLETTGELESNSFMIESSPIMFDILSSKLYSDPIRACVREICCNALDTKAKEPFVVSTPGTLSPFWSCRDFGPGLSPEDVRYLYTTYGRSLKRDSNDVIGGFGLGSKAPFAKTNTFNVESWHKGYYSSYSCVIENGYPKIYVLVDSEYKPEEPSGLKVSIPCNPNEFIQWRAKTLEVLKCFPEGSFKGITVEVLQDIKNLKDNSCIIIDTHNTQGVLCGPCLYSLDYSFLKDSANDQLPSLLFRVPIGSVTIAPNRESLVYDEVTKQTLNKIWKEHVKNLSNSLFQNLETLKDSGFLSVLYLRENLSKLPWSLRNLFEREIRKTKFSNLLDMRSYLPVEEIKRDKIRLYNFSFTLLPRPPVYLNEHYNIILNDIQQTNNTTPNFPSERTLLRFLKENFLTKGATQNFVVIDDLKILNEVYKNPPYFKMSDIKKAYDDHKEYLKKITPKVKRESKKFSEEDFIKIQVIKDHKKASCSAKEILDELKKPNGCYILTNKGRTTGLSSIRQAGEFEEYTMFDLIKELFPVTYKDYLVFPKTFERKIPKNWINLTNEIVIKVSKDLKEFKEKHIEDYLIYKRFNAINVTYQLFLSEFLDTTNSVFSLKRNDILAKLDINTDLVLFYEKLVSLKQKPPLFGDILSVYLRYNFITYTSDFDQRVFNPWLDKLKKESEQLARKYPLIFQREYSNNLRVPLEHILEYITFRNNPKDLVDSNKLGYP